jgi:hypothetical protein
MGGLGGGKVRRKVGISFRATSSILDILYLRVYVYLDLSDDEENTLVKWA